MNYAFMTFSTPKQTWDEILEMAKRYGYAGVEPRITSKHAHGIEPDADDAVLEQARQKAADAGIAICCVATSCRYSNPAEVSENLTATREAIVLAGKLGCPRLRVFGGAIAEGIERPQAIDNLAQALKQVADFAQDHQVTICVETHDDWCNAHDLAAALEKADHAAIAANWDIMHPIRRGGNTMDEAFETLKPWIKHVHVHDGTREDPVKFLPIGEGCVDHKRALELLKSMRYTGFVSGEWINWQEPEEHLPREMDTLLKLEASV